MGEVRRLRDLGAGRRAWLWDSFAYAACAAVLAQTNVPPELVVASDRRVPVNFTDGLRVLKPC